MRLCTIGQTEIRVSIGVLALLVVSAATQALGTLLSSLWALALHEACHALTASALGYTCASFELLPFGASLRLRGTVEPAAMLSIALAGPVGSLVAAMACSLAARYIPTAAAMLEPMIRANLLLALFNLLPAQPLDGAKVLKALLERVMSAKKALSVTIWLGIALSGILLGAFVWICMEGTLNATLLMAAALLLVHSIREWRSKPLSLAGATHRKGTRLHREGVMHARVLTVDAETTASLALKQLSPGGYHMLLVVDERLRLLGQLGEGELMDGLLKYGEDVTLKKMLKGMQ